MTGYTEVRLPQGGSISAHWSLVCSGDTLLVG